MKRSAWVVAGTALLLAAFAAMSAGCGPGGPSGGRIDIEGFVSSIWGINEDPGYGEVLGSILVDGEDTAGAGYGKASVNVTRETRIWEMTGSGAKSVALEDIEVGLLVQVAFTGPVAESYPVQATASEIVIARRTGIGEVLERHRDELMSIKGVTGLGVTGVNGEPAILLYIESDDPTLKTRIPAEIEGFEVLTEVTGPIEIMPI